MSAKYEYNPEMNTVIPNSDTKQEGDDNTSLHIHFNNTP